MENLSQKHGLVSRTYYKNSLIMASTFGSKSKFFYDHVNPVTRRTIDQSAGGKLRDRNAEESWALLEDLALYDNESWNDPMDFAKLVKAIALPQDVPINKVTTSCEICSGPHDTQYFMKDPEQAFVEYASSRTDEAGDARLSKFEADFKQQQNEMTNKIDTVLKAITDRIAGALPRDMVKNPKLSTSLVLSARSYLTMDPQCLTHVHGSINAVTIHPKQQSNSYDDRTEENEEEEKVSLENINVDPSTSLDPSFSFISKKSSNSIHSSNRSVKKYDDSHEEEPEAEEHEVDYFDIFLTRSELAYHKKDNGMHVFVGNFTYIVDFMIVEDISSIIDPRLSQLVLGKPFVEISNMTHDPPEGVVRFINGTDEVAYKMPHKIEQYNSLSDLEKEHTKSVYLRNEKDKRRGVEYVMSKILEFYKECLELRPEYVTRMDNE
ncbi:hypothetical protein Tco_0692897 [Tanacetum coccineum]